MACLIRVDLKGAHGLQVMEIDNRVPCSFCLFFLGRFEFARTSESARICHLHFNPLLVVCTEKNLTCAGDRLPEEKRKTDQEVAESTGMTLESGVLVWVSQ